MTIRGFEKQKEQPNFMLNRIQGPEKVKVGLNPDHHVLEIKEPVQGPVVKKLGLRSFPGEGRWGDDADIQAMSEQPEE